MDTQYLGRSGKVYYISDRFIAGGGEGTIYEVTGTPWVVAKIFKDKYRTKERENKILIMLNHSIENVTWPLDILYDVHAKFAGYIMPKLNHTKNLNYIYSAGLKNIDLKNKLLIAYNLCVAVDAVHSVGQVCGDLNPQNICINYIEGIPIRDAFKVTLVDSDSYHIISKDFVYRCEVGLAEYLAPELHNKIVNGLTLKNAPLPTYTKETDLFALAVHIFSLLMNGCHPFACAVQFDNNENTFIQDSVVAPQPIENIKSGFFPFNQKRENITYPLYALSFESLPADIRAMFIRTFEEGYKNPLKRPSAKEWMEVLKANAYSTNFTLCHYRHCYFSHNTLCPYCKTFERMKKISMDNFKTTVPNSKEGKSTTASNQGSVYRYIPPKGSANATTVTGTGTNNANVKINVQQKKKSNAWKYILFFIICILLMIAIMTNTDGAEINKDNEQLNIAETISNIAEIETKEGENL